MPIQNFSTYFLPLWDWMFLKIKEKRFARHVIKRLLESHSVVSAEKPDLSDKALYREVLLHTQQVDPSRVDEILRQAEDSIDQWTATGRSVLGLREVAHFCVMLLHLEAGYKGAVVSFGEIVNTMIPAHL